jgi:drug/metabolite transporter (DMT)-like permease
MAFAFSLLLHTCFSLKDLRCQRKTPLISCCLWCIICLTWAVWNIAIQESSATQASLLTNLSPFGLELYLMFFKYKTSYDFWIGTTVALFGMAMLVGFQFFLELDFDMLLS